MQTFSDSLHVSFLLKNRWEEGVTNSASLIKTGVMLTGILIG